MYPHCIRLREPWTRTPRDGGVTLRRGFHRPTISGAERVWLVCEAATAAMTVALDGRPLGEIEPGRPLWSHDLTDSLAARHELTFEIAEPPEGSLPWREVRLEVRLHSTP